MLSSSEAARSVLRYAVLPASRGHRDRRVMAEGPIVSNAVAMHSMMFTPAVPALHSYEKPPRRSGNGSPSP